MVVTDHERDRRLVRLGDVQGLLRLDHVGRRGLDGHDRLVEIEVGPGGDCEAERGDRQEGAKEDPADQPDP